MKDIFEQIKDAEKITVDLQVIPDSQFSQLIKTKVASGEAPDLVSQNSQQLLVLGADNFADLSSEPWIERLSMPDTIKSDDGKIQMFPLKGYSYFGGVWYNKKVFNDLGITPNPATYAEFLAIADKVKNSGKDITPIYMSDKDSWTSQIFCASAFSIALNPNEKDIASKIYKNELKLTDVPELKKSLQDYLDLYSKGYTNKNHLSATWDMAKEALANGNAAMVINGDWVVNDIKAKWPDKVQDIGHFALPYNDKEIVNTGKDIQSLFVAANSKNLDAVKRFLNAYSQPEYQNKYYTANPAPVAAFKDCDGGQVEEVIKQSVEKYVTSGKTVYEFPDLMPEAYSAYTDSFMLNLGAGSVGKKNVDDILKEYQQKYEEIMKVKKMPGW